jgi:hypothetical protein
VAYPDLLGSRIPDEALDRMLGIAPPDLPEDVPDQGFETTGWERFLEGLQRPTARPRGFGQSFLAGLTGQLAGQGSRIAARRAKFEAQQDKSKAEKDEQRRKSTEEYRKERGLALRDLSKSQREEREKAAVYERDNPALTPEMLKAAPWLARVAGPDGRVPRSALMTAMKPESTPRETGLAVIMGPDGKPINVRPSAALGKQPYIRADEAAKTKPSTGEQKQALAFYNRGKEAIGVLDQKDKTGMTLEDRIAAVNPLLGAFGQRTINPLKGRDRQVYEQAQRAFTQAKLRKESGAAISAPEYESDAQTYFAQPGDGPDVIANKKAMRDGVLEGLKFQSGPAYAEFYGEETAPPTQATAAVGTAVSRARPPLSSFNRP